MIYKKGNTSKLENYRPISLLNSLFKIYASIIQKRLEDKLDRHLQQTQYGFRRKRGTADAIQCVRRIAEHSEQTTTKTILLLLDWEKAFDKVTRPGLMSALGRMGVPEKLLRVIGDMYAQPTFKVEMEGTSSEWRRQETGIRQGCPMSPYLFLAVMTVLFHDVHRGDPQNMIEHRIPGTTYDEIVYADDTICVSTDTRALNKLLADIEREGAKYGMRLNKGKCEVMHNSNVANVHFADGTPVPRKDEVRYLGCHLNQTSDSTREVNSRICMCMATLRRLDLFWRHSNCTAALKLHVMNAVVRAKLLYGLESAQLSDTHVAKLNTFQLKGLRKILHMKTTFVERANTNQLVIQKANETLGEGGRGKRLELFSEAYKQSRAT